MIPSESKYQITSELVFSNRVPFPTFYKDYKGNLKKFEKIKDQTKTIFKSLLQYISPEANINSTPILRNFHCRHANMSVLNYTENCITFNKNRKLCVNKQNVIRYPKDNCRLITYNVHSLLDVICIEQQNDNEIFPVERCFIVKDYHEFLYIDLLMLSMFTSNKNLTNKISFQIADVEVFIKSDPCMSHLIQKVAKEASLKGNPTLTQFLPYKNSPRFTILNYTDQQFYFKFFRRLYINDEEFSYFNQGVCQIIAYYLEGHPEMICIEQQGEKNEICNSRLYANRVWKHCDDSTEYNEVMELIHKDLAFLFLWKGIDDEESFLRKEGLPQDLVIEITKIYLFISLNKSLVFNSNNNSCEGYLRY